MRLVGILGFGALLIVAFGYFAIFGGGTTTEITPATKLNTRGVSEPVTPESEPVEREAFSGADTIRALYERGESLECQITYIPNPLEPEIIGSVFTDEGRVRADFVVPTPDLAGQAVSSIIYDTPDLYVWTDIGGEVIGIKRQHDTFIGSRDSAAVVDYDTEVQYDCLTWPQVDNTIFEPPTNVLFNDVSDINMEFGTIYEDQDGELPL